MPWMGLDGSGRALPIPSSAPFFVLAIIHAAAAPAYATIDRLSRRRRRAAAASSGHGRGNALIIRELGNIGMRQGEHGLLCAVSPKSHNFEWVVRS